MLAARVALAGFTTEMLGPINTAGSLEHQEQNSSKITHSLSCTAKPCTVLRDGEPPIGSTARITLQSQISFWCEHRVIAGHPTQALK